MVLRLGRIVRPRLVAWKESFCATKFGSSVGERFARAGASAFLQLTGFEDFAAVEALHIFRVAIFGNHAGAFVLAGFVWHRENSIRGKYNCSTGALRWRAHTRS